MTDGRALLEAHLNGEPLTEAQRAALSAWVCASRDNARLVAELTHFNEAIALNIKAQSFGTLMDSPEADLFQDAFDQDKPPAERDEQELPPIHIDANALTKEKYLSALTYVIKHTFTPKRVATLAAAAVLLLGMALTIALLTGPDPQEHLTDNTLDQNKPAESAQPILRDQTTTPVATLTNTHNAQWSNTPAERALARGSELHPGTRLTLTAGIAEITTARGAIAIIQAPATIELLNNNALHLHTGKLVGICETESSKGFLVRTPHMDITDLGTEFGVEVQGNNFMATVFTGEIELTFPGSDPQTLTQNQTGRLRVDGDSRELIVEDKLAQGFDTLLPHRVLANALRNDPAMIAYYGFEAEDIVDGKLINRAVATLGTMDGVLGQPGRPDSQPQITQGRAPGSGALRFEASEFDIVRVSAADAQVLDGLEQFTIGLWVRPDDMDRTSHHLVTMRQARGENDALNLALVWDGPRGKEFRPNSVLFHTNLGEALIQQQATAAQSLQRRSAWVHVLVTFDRGERAIYLDGQLQARLPRIDSDRVPAIDADLLIGAAAPHLKDPLTYLDGDLDELFILGRPLSETEIQALYQAGVPMD